MRGVRKQSYCTFNDLWPSLRLHLGCTLLRETSGSCESDRDVSRNQKSQGGVYFLPTKSNCVMCMHDGLFYLQLICRYSNTIWD